MKKMTLILILFILFTGCKEEQQQLDTASIYGTWQLIETEIGIPSLGGGGPLLVSEGYSISFSQNFKFTSYCKENGKILHTGYVIGACTNSNGKNMNGDFALSQENGITLVFNEIVDGFATDESAQERNYLFHFEGQYLILRNPLCDEGCYDKLEKMPDYVGK